eukprot:12547134-Ditylum_brightwellii.AAC.1
MTIPTITSSRKRLKLWADFLSYMFQHYVHGISVHTSMYIEKFRSRGAISSDTCPGVRKTCQLLFKQVQETAVALNKVNYTNITNLEQDFWNHLCNVWPVGMINVLSIMLYRLLWEELDVIDSQLQVSTSFEPVLSTVDKEFSLCANYPNRHGDLICDWMQCFHSGALLLHVEQASGSCQDLAVEGA